MAAFTEKDVSFGRVIKMKSWASKVYEGQKVCYTCRHYHQHYGFDRGKYFEVDWGHCAKPRIKARRQDQTCDKWTPREEK